MNVTTCSVNLTLKEIQKAVNSIGNFMENILNCHSLTLVINLSGEATFTPSGCKLLSEAGFSHPLTKFIANAAMNFTSSCGDDCKSFIFILQEILGIMLNKINTEDEILMRRKLINEIYTFKQLLPCIFKSIYDIPNVHMIVLGSDLFYKTLYSIVLTFMLSRFSVNVSKILSSLVCDFMQNIVCEPTSLKIILEYVTSHFDIFFCKVLSSISESRLVKGFIFNRKDIPTNLNLQNSKFIIILDLSLKMETKDVSWKIVNESFSLQLNSLCYYQNVIENFKLQGVELLLTPSVSDNNLKILCKKYGIHLIDRLEKEEIEHVLSCVHLCPLENVNESLKSKNIGELTFARSLSCNNSHFLHLCCINSIRVLNPHHILLSAPCNLIWKEYFFECLNCFKMIHQWLKSDTNVCLRNDDVDKATDNLSRSLIAVSITTESKHCNVCSKLNDSYENYPNKSISFHAVGIPGKSRYLLPPGAWEYLFKNCLKQVPDTFKFSCSTILQAMYFAFEKCLYKKIGISLSNTKNVDVICKAFFAKNKVNFLEPVICKEIMIYCILDLILQLLKIESIIFLK